MAKIPTCYGEYCAFPDNDDKCCMYLPGGPQAPVPHDWREQVSSLSKINAELLEALDEAWQAYEDGIPVWVSSASADKARVVIAKAKGGTT